MSNGCSLLSILVFLPLAGCLLLIPLWKRENYAKPIASAIALVELALAGWIYLTAVRLGIGSANMAGFFLSEDIAWIPRFGIRYTLGMDGISLLLTLLTSFIIVIAMLVSWRGVNKLGTLHYLLILLDGKRHHGGLSQPRPLPLLPLLGGDADPDVLPDRHLGQRPAHLLDGEVLPLHPGRLAPHAPGNHRPLPDPRQPDRRLHLCPGRTAAYGTLPCCRLLAVRRLSARFCHQGADFPVSTPGSPTPTATRRPPAP